MTKQNKSKIRIPKWLAITFLVLGILFLLGGTTGEVDMLIIGTFLTALAIVGFVGNRKKLTKTKPVATQPEKVAPITAPIAQHQTTQQPKKKSWYAKWWGILLIIFALIPIGLTIFIMTFAIQSANETYRQENTSERVAEREQQEAAEQEKRKQETAAKYQETIDTYAPIYCKNHQDITVNEPELHEDGWPLANNQAGISEDDCKILLGLLYAQRANDPQVTEFIQLIAERKVAIGMTKVEVVYAWGSPNDINRTISSNSTWEQWVFGNPIYGANYVYFDDDIVTSMQN